MFLTLKKVTYFHAQNEKQQTNVQVHTEISI